MTASPALTRSLCTILFLGFLYPVTINAVSANYAFLTLPAIYFLVVGRLERIPQYLGLLIFLFCLLFVFGSIHVTLTGQEFPERLIFSFITFISVFSFVILGVTNNNIISFKRAVVIITLFFSFKAIFVFLSGGGSAAGFEQKDMVGSQRYGFIYLIAFYTILLWKTTNKMQILFRLGSLVVITLGLFLTFSRASIVGLSVSLLCLWIYLVAKGRFGFIPTLKLLVAAAAALILVSFLAKDFYILFDFFTERLVDRLFLGDSEIFLSADSSEGTRIEIWTAVIEHTIASPLWGAGYLGTWSLTNIVAGSAHSQYMDILFRVGFLGAILWCLAVFPAYKLLLAEHPDLFWGYFGVLIYGLFHETFKESHGAFVLAFLIGMYATHLRRAVADGEAALDTAAPDLSRVG